MQAKIKRQGLLQPGAAGHRRRQPLALHLRPDLAGSELALFLLLPLQSPGNLETRNGCLSASLTDLQIEQQLSQCLSLSEPTFGIKVCVKK